MGELGMGGNSLDGMLAGAAAPTALAPASVPEIAEKLPPQPRSVVPKPAAK
jgi:hypothetical protein